MVFRSSSYCLRSVGGRWLTHRTTGRYTVSTRYWRASRRVRSARRRRVHHRHRRVADRVVARVDEELVKDLVEYEIDNDPFAGKPFSGRVEDELLAFDHFI